MSNTNDQQWEEEQENQNTVSTTNKPNNKIWTVRNAYRRLVNFQKNKIKTYYIQDDEDDSNEDEEEDSSNDSAVEDDQTSYLRVLRDELQEEQERCSERQRAYEAKSAEQR